MRTIWKFAAPTIHDEVISIDMPRGADLLCVQMQYGQPMLWAIVNPDLPEESRAFRWEMTGGAIRPSSHTYIGTVQNNGLVLHLFEVGSPSQLSPAKSAAASTEHADLLT